MPGGNSMGPYGAGPRTGRGMGFCSGYGAPGYMNAGFGRGRGAGMGGGFGRGSGRGFGFAGRFAYGVPAVSEKEVLENETSALEAELKAVRARLEELEKQSGK